VALTVDQDASFDFALQKGAVRWNEISHIRETTLPAGKRQRLDFQPVQHFVINFKAVWLPSRATRRAWRDRVAYMREAMHFSIFLGPHFSDQDAADVASYLTSLFGLDSVLPKSPADVTGYKETLRPFSSDAMNICVCRV